MAQGGRPGRRGRDGQQQGNGTRSSDLAADGEGVAVAVALRWLLHWNDSDNSRSGGGCCGVLATEQINRRLSVIAVPDWSNSDTGVRSATFAAPLATRAPFAKPVVAMPAAGPALARLVVAMNQNHVVTQALWRMTHCCGGGARNRCYRRKQDCSA